MAYDIFQLVQDFQRDPSHFGDLISPDKPLPEDLGRLLEEIAAMEPSQEDGGRYEALVSAAAFFVERVLFVPGGDFYRYLGVDRHATQECIRRHYHLLMHLFMLDREDMADGWSAELAERINRAYFILRDPAKRREYDARLAGKSPAGAGLEQEMEGKSLARSIVSFAKARNLSRPERGSPAAGAAAGESLSRPAPPTGAAATSENIAVNSAVASGRDEESFIADSIERAYGDAGVRVAPAHESEPLRDAAGSPESGHHIRVEPILADEDLGSGVEAVYQRRSQAARSSRWGRILVLLLVLLAGLAAAYEFLLAPGQLSALFVPEQPRPGLTAPPSVTAPSGSGSTTPILEQEVETAPAVDEGEKHLVAPGEGDGEPAREQGGEGPQPVDEARPETALAVQEDISGLSLEEEDDPVVTGLTLSPRRTSRLPEVPEEETGTPVSSQDKALAPPARPAASSTARAVEKKTPSPAPVQARPVASPPVSSARPAPEPAPPAPARPVVAPPPVAKPAPGPAEAASAARLAASGESTPSSGGMNLAAVAPPPPATALPAIEPIPREELDGLMRTFVRSYEEGNLQRLLSVFAKDAHTNDRQNREGIAADYQELFDVTEKRQFIVEDLDWRQVDEDRAKGEGEFEVKVLLKGETSITTVRGQVEIDVEKRGRDLLITGFYHTYE